MPAIPPLVLASSALVLVILGLRAFALNRVIRSRLLFSLLLLAGVLVLHAELGVSADPELRDTLDSMARLLFVLACIQLVVVLIINPLRVDRIPDRFPTIVQDTVVVGLFLVVATFLLDERFLTTSAVGAVVVGFALQDTLGNMFAGLALQVEKPFHVGHWITVGEWEGSVVEVSWRATKLRTRQGNLVVVPNSTIADEAITNYSEPIAPTRITVEVGSTYSTPPNHVKATILEAMADEPVVRAAPPPSVVFSNFGDSSLQYAVHVWIDDYAQKDVAADRVRTAIYYAFSRAGIEIPFPIAIEVQREDVVEPESVRVGRIDTVLGRAALLTALTPAERMELAAASFERLFGSGEPIVRQGQAGMSAFVIGSGRVCELVGPEERQVAELGPGDYFGEMSLLTGEGRSATVRALVDCRLVEVTADAFRRIALANPSVLDAITTTVAARRAELAVARQGAASATSVDAEALTLLGRVRRFLLGSARPA